MSPPSVETYSSLIECVRHVIFIRKFVFQLVLN
jgi:hypothetical protein